MRVLNTLSGMLYCSPPWPSDTSCTGILWEPFLRMFTILLFWRAWLPAWW